MSVDDMNSGIECARVLSGLLYQGRFMLTKWMSNSRGVLKLILPIEVNDGDRTRTIGDPVASVRRRGEFSSQAGTV